MILKCCYFFQPGGCLYQNPGTPSLLYRAREKHTHMCTGMHVYMYIYVYNLHMYIHVHVRVYIYTHTHTLGDFERLLYWWGLQPEIPVMTLGLGFLCWGSSLPKHALCLAFSMYTSKPRPEPWPYHCRGGGSRVPGGMTASHSLCRRAAHLRQKETGMVELGSDCSLGRLGPEKEGEGQASQRKPPTHRAFLCGREPGGAPSSSTFLLGPEAAEGPAASRGNAPGLCFTWFPEHKVDQREPLASCLTLLWEFTTQGWLPASRPSLALPHYSTWAWK